MTNTNTLNFETAGLAASGVVLGKGICKLPVLKSIINTVRSRPEIRPYWILNQELVIKTFIMETVKYVRPVLIWFKGCQRQSKP
jgi:hypothetical protein